MNFKNYLLILFLLISVALTAQDTPTAKLEFGVSLFSITREFEAGSIDFYRNSHVGLFNGYIFKYHRPNNGSFRFRMRIIGQQSMGTNSEAFDGAQLGDNFNDIGFEIATGYQLFINKNDGWKYYWGADLGYIFNKENRRSSFLAGRSINKYSSLSIYSFLGVKRRASKYLSFSLETSAVFGIFKYSKRSFPHSGTIVQSYWNPVSILSATLTIPQRNKN